MSIVCGANEKALAPQSSVMLVGIRLGPHTGKSCWEKLRFKHCLYTFLKLIIKPIILK